MPNLYVSLSQIKDPGNLNITETTFDTMLLTWAESASRFIDDEAKRFFYCLEQTLTFNGAGRTLNLPMDLLSVSAINLDNGTQTYPQTLNATDYILNPTYALKGHDAGPYTFIVPSLNSGIGNFASNIPAGVQITGVWGYGTGMTPTPYTASGAVVGSGNMTNTATTHALGAGQGALLSPGQTIRIDTEQMYVVSIATDTLTLQRGMNGTTAASHTSGTAISIYQYHPVVVSCALVQVGIWWNRRKNAFTAVEGNPEMGTAQIYKGLDPMVKEMIYNGRLIRKTI